MTLNIELAERVLEQIRMHPETHDQDIWGVQNDCGTQACIAGWTLLLAGEARLDNHGGTISCRGYGPSRDLRIAERARQLLGLVDTGRLFWGTVEDVYSNEDARDMLESLIKNARNAATS